MSEETAEKERPVADSDNDERTDGAVETDNEQTPTDATEATEATEHVSVGDYDKRSDRLLARAGRSIPLLIPGWLATYPVRWLLSEQSLVSAPGFVGILLVTLTAFLMAGDGEDAKTAAIFSVEFAAFFFVLQEVLSPPMSSVQGNPRLLLGPVLTLLGAATFAYLLAYRNAAFALWRWLVDLRYGFDRDHEASSADDS
ncbi:hypothetical protein [Haloarchaeobius sp. DFWS5]|uniref:hypothetical protein n=1 Tax=Haloarchaeobius sp. DFWS5 TaxID=3446114 RepID=UPI003EB89AB9